MFCGGGVAGNSATNFVAECTPTAGNNAPCIRGSMPSLVGMKAMVPPRRCSLDLGIARWGGEPPGRHPFHHPLSLFPQAHAPPPPGPPHITIYNFPSSLRPTFTSRLKTSQTLERMWKKPFTRYLRISLFYVVLFLSAEFSFHFGE